MIPCTKRCYIFIVGHLREVVNTVHKRSLGYGVMELNKDYYTLLACWWVDAHSLENKRTALRRNGRERFVLTQMGGYSILAFFSIVHPLRLESSQSAPLNILAACSSPLSCQLSHARATTENSPP